MREMDVHNILIVDDEKDICNLLKEALIEEGYRVFTVQSGIKAIEEAKEKPFSLALIDLKMPVMDGLETLDRLKEVSPDIIPIIITAYPSVDTAISAIKRKAYDYINKPFDINGLKDTIKKAIKKYMEEQEEREMYISRRLSILDGITELYNYSYFREVLGREIRRATRYPQFVSLLIIDIDDFKDYNNKNGYLAGDRALRRLADIIQQTTRRVDLIARYGGEKFVILTPQTRKEEANILGERIRKKIENTKFEQGQLTVSIGLATFPIDADSEETLIQKAEEALFRAKGLGKNRLCLADG